jgi:hypothetical protein
MMEHKQQEATASNIEHDGAQIGPDSMQSNTRTQASAAIAS